MLTLNECKKVLNNNNKNYTDEEIILIRDWLSHFADTALLHLENCQEKENIIATK